MSKLLELFQTVPIQDVKGFLGAVYDEFDVLNSYIDPSNSDHIDSFVSVIFRFCILGEDLYGSGMFCAISPTLLFLTTAFSDDDVVNVSLVSLTYFALQLNMTSAAVELMKEF